MDKKIKQVFIFLIIVSFMAGFMLGYVAYSMTQIDTTTIMENNIKDIYKLKNELVECKNDLRNMLLYEESNITVKLCNISQN